MSIEPPYLIGSQYRNNFLPKDVKIIGYARTKMDHNEYLKRVKSYIKTPTKDMEEQLDDFCKLATYVSGQYDQDESFINLNKHLEELEKGRKETNRVFYMALPPSVFIPVSQHLKKNCYPKSGIARVIVSGPESRYLGTQHNSADLLKTGRKTFRQRSCKLSRTSKSIGSKLERGGDFPNRPLLGQGDGEEHSHPSFW